MAKSGHTFISSIFVILKITQDVREYAKEQNVTEEKALAVGMAEMAKEFVKSGSEIYQGNVPKVRKSVIK